MKARISQKAVHTQILHANARLHSLNRWANVGFEIFFITVKIFYQHVRITADLVDPHKGPVFQPAPLSKTAALQGIDVCA